MSVCLQHLIHKGSLYYFGKLTVRPYHVVEINLMDR